jgi:hypothetical protein
MPGNPAFTGYLLLICLFIPASSRADEDTRPLVFGVNRVANPWVLFDPPDYDEHVYRRVAEANGTCVRLAASPREIERVRGKRDWSEFDRDLDLALKYRQEPVVLIVNTPAWASPIGEDTHLYPYKTELLPEFADFCTELARRTRGKVRLFQLWNEQNGCSWHFHDGFNHADEYLPVLKVCQDALKKGNPECVLSLGSLDDAEGNAPIFLRKTYEEMERQDVDGPLFEAVSDHPYSPDSSVMRAKLDALSAILEAHGDGEIPFWITEYGWQIGDRKPDEQASRLAEVLAAFIRPDWRDLKMAIYLCIADFPGGKGFGLCDANLRPRPGFHAFQGASRFGAYPPFGIEPVFTRADTLQVTWKTLQPTTGTLTLSPAEGKGSELRRASPAGTEHRVEIGGLESDKDYTFSIETVTADSEAKRFRSVPYTIHTPTTNLHNGGFENGFFAGIADGWRIAGDGYCTDAACIPFASVREGQHAQAVFARGDKGHERIDSTLSAPFVVRPGGAAEVQASWSAPVTGANSRVEARLGIDPTGGNDAGAERIVWTDWNRVGRAWEQVAVSARPAGTLARVYIQCRSRGSLGKGTSAFLVDDVRTLTAINQQGQ